MSKNTKEVKDEFYKELSHSWTDMWAEDDGEVSVSYRFRRPSTAEINRMQSSAVKNAATASRNLLVTTVHPDDADKLAADLERYPALVATLSSAIIRSCGLADLGNG